MNKTKEIGNLIRTYRKAKNMTIIELGKKINKSKATISKYEKGEIVIDIETLYDISDALNVKISNLLPIETSTVITPYVEVPSFFKEKNQLYGYIYDGRNNQVIKVVIDILGKEDDDYKVMMYMNYKDLSHYQSCENTYYGTLHHYDAITHIQLSNISSPMEKASLQILASFLDSPTKFGLFNGFSIRPMMPIATKMLISKEPLDINNKLVELIKISKEDIRLLKLYNMLCVL